MKKGSWKTTVGGVGTILAAIGGAMTAMTDGSSTTNPDWNQVIIAITAGLGLIFARDNNVSSEQAGCNTANCKETNDKGTP